MEKDDFLNPNYPFYISYPDYYIRCLGCYVSNYVKDGIKHIEVTCNHQNKIETVKI